MTNARPDYRPAALVLVLTLLAYLPIMRGGYIWDDDDYVTTNLALRTPAGLMDIWVHPRATPQYYPLVFTSFWLEHAFWSFNPSGYHLVNVLLHASAAILLWHVLLELNLGARAALLAACIFAVHPVHVESAAWITERKNVLSAVLYFAAGLMFLRGRSAWAVLLFLGALLSKSVSCSLPAALLLVCYWKGRSLTRREIAAVVAMFVLGVALALHTALLERTQVGAAGAEWNYSLAQRILIAGRAIWFYFTKLLLPIDLSFVYAKWTIRPEQFWQWAFPLGVVAAVAVLYLQRRRWGRGPLVAALFFIGTLVPALGFFNIYPMRYTFVADHYVYIASLGVLIPLAIAVDRVSRGHAAVSIALMGVLMILTFVRASVFRDVESLWRDTVAKNPDSWMVHLNLAKVLDARGQYIEAEREFRRQAELGPEVFDTHLDLGVYLANHDQLGEAIQELRHALEMNPDLAQIHYHLGRAYQKAGMRDEALAEYRRAVDLRPDYVMAHLYLGLVLNEQGQFSEARPHFEMVIRTNPEVARRFGLLRP